MGIIGKALGKSLKRMGNSGLIVARGLVGVERNTNALDLRAYGDAMRKLAEEKIAPVMSSVAHRGVGTLRRAIGKSKRPVDLSGVSAASTRRIVATEMRDLQRTTTRFRNAMPPTVPGVLAAEVARGLGGVPPRSAARLARELDKRLQRFDEREAKRMLFADADRLRRQRATAIADESITDVYASALVEAGPVYGIVDWLWRVEDGDACQICAPLDGKSIDDVGRPPAHAR